MKKQNMKKNKDENFILYLLIILLLIIVFVYHCNFKKKNKNISKEGFKSRYSTMHLAGTQLLNITKGNPLLPRNQQNITLVSCQGDFHNKKKSTSQKEKLYLDNKSDGIILLPKGYIKVDLDNYEKIDSIVIKGLKKGRVDIDNGKKNEYKKLFNINTEFCDDLLQYNKLNINQLNRISPRTDLKIKSLKITNTSNKPSEPVKLEIMKQYNASMKTNKRSNKVTKKTILNYNDTKVKSLIVNQENNLKSFIKIVLPQAILLNGFSLKTNISSFKVVFGKDGFKKGQLFNGGVNGVNTIHYYFDNPVKTKELKIIPFIHPKRISEKKYFMNDINIYKFSSQIKEGFVGETSDTSETKDSIIDDVHDSIDIQQACRALSYQEDINKESYKLEQFKKYSLKLQKQEQELEMLNKIITKLKDKRNQQMEKEDILSVVKYQQLKGEEVKLLEKLKENKNRSIDLNLDFVKDE